MIRFHGGPITPLVCANEVWNGRHAMVSFAHPEQISLAADVAQSFALDNGAYTLWKEQSQAEYPWDDWFQWVKPWLSHPGLAFVVLPDVVDGTAEQNEQLASRWWMEHDVPHHMGVPVWHLHEPIKRLVSLSRRCQTVALGSSGEYAQPGVDQWWDRMADAMDSICDSTGRPRCRLHGLRMMNPSIFAHVPFASVDSTSVARNIGLDQNWVGGPYPPLTKKARAVVLADRFESHACAARWSREARHTQMNFELVG